MRLQQRDAALYAACGDFVREFQGSLHRNMEEKWFHFGVQFLEQGTDDRKEKRASSAS